MQRAFTVVVLLALLGALASFGPDGGTGTSTAQAAHCKKKHRGHHKRHSGKKKHPGRCHGSEPAGTGGGDGTAGGSATCSNTAASPGRVGAHETEYAITLTRPSVGCGKVIVEQDNFGMDAHDLQLQRAGDTSPTYSFAQVGPGGVVKQTLDLPKGTWVLYCSILDHRAQGMEVTLNVD